MLEFVEVAAASAAGCCVVLGLRWLDDAVMARLGGDVGLPHREVATNALSDVGFVAMSVRVKEGLTLSDEQHDYVVSRVDAASSRLCDELRLCGACQRWGGLHDIGCVEVRDMVDMAADSMMCEELNRETLSTEDFKASALRRHLDAEDA